MKKLSKGSVAYISINNKKNQVSLAFEISIENTTAEEALSIVDAIKSHYTKAKKTKKVNKANAASRKPRVKKTDTKSPSSTV